MDSPQEDLQRYQNRSAAGGVNTRLFALDIREDQAAELQNIDVTIPGQRKKRTGFSYIATGITNSPILALSEFKPRGSVPTELLAIAPGASWNELWKWNGVGAVWTFVSELVGHEFGTRAHIAIGQDFVGSMNHVKEAVIICESARYRYNYGYTGVTGNYVSHLATCYYGGTNAAGTLIFPNGNALEFAYSQGWGSCGDDHEGRIAFSDVASWTSTGFGDPGCQAIHLVTLGGGRRQNVMAIRGFRNQELVIFLSDRIEELIVKEDEATAITDITAAITTKLWQRRIIDDTIGCGAQRSVVKVSEDILFVDQYGNVRSLMRTALDASQGTRSLPISDPIDAYIQRINKVHLSKVCAAAYDRWYIITFPLDAATVPNTTFRYDTSLNAWEGPYTGVTANAWTVGTLDHASAADALKNPNLYFGDSGSGLVYRMFTGESDNGAAIEFKETTKRIDYGQLDLMKQWIRLELLGLSTANVDVTVEANTGSGWTTIGTVNTTGESPTLPHGFPLTLGGVGLVLGKISLEGLERSRDIQFRFTASSATDTIKLLGFTVYAFPENYEWDVASPATQVL